MEQVEIQPVSREAVFKVASLILETSTQVPALALMKPYFETPTSPAIAVYLREWKAIHRDELAALFPSAGKLKERCERLQGELSSIATAYECVRIELADFRDWLQANHPYILTEWNNYGVQEE